MVRKPEWLKVRLPSGPSYLRIRDKVQAEGLHTVCESAACPNIGECWGKGTATLMILGNVCTRSCGFCNVATGKPGPVDRDEPRRVAETIKMMRLQFVVVTSVDRDDLPDGGAGIWAETIRQVRAVNPETKIEVLTPDFQGRLDQVDTVLAAAPDVFAHNLETVPRLHRRVRVQARYDRSLAVLRHARDRGFITKSALLVGLGETYEELVAVMEALAGVGCDILTVGQYLQPTRRHLPVERFVPPGEFARLKKAGERLGIRWVEAGPLVRSSYFAETQHAAMVAAGG